MTTAEILAAARRVPCPQCGTDPLEACWPPLGVHLVRIQQARRDGLIGQPDLTSVLGAVLAQAVPAEFGAGEAA